MDTQGHGTYSDGKGNVYEGEFVNGSLNGTGRVTGKEGNRYDGEFKEWRFQGRGVLRLASGDVYTGAFADGLYEGEGTLVYAKARPDGRTQDTGTWHFGRLKGAQDERRARVSVESALYMQRALLDAALAAVAPRDPDRINLYFLGIAGDGSQEVFRREVDFVRAEFDRSYGTQGRSLSLINSRNTLDSAPMATMTSIREALSVIASRMDKEKDILFVYLTSHGSEEHDLTLDVDGMNLRNLPAKELGSLLAATGVRWKVVVVSACYAGGFIDFLKDDSTLAIAAARRDRRSFGCADENDFTYFGRAYFKDALPESDSFEQAFHKAETLVQQWEERDQTAAGKKDEATNSYPQMYDTPAIEAYLKTWRKQTHALTAYYRHPRESGDPFATVKEPMDSRFRGNDEFGFVTSSLLPGILPALPRQQRLDLAAVDQPLHVACPANQHALDEHHRKRRPAGPHLERVAALPRAEVAAVAQVLVGDACGVERLARLLRMRVLLHADHDHIVRGHRRLDLADDARVTVRDRLPDLRVNVRFVEHVAGHRFP